LEIRANYLKLLIDY